MMNAIDWSRSFLIAAALTSLAACVTTPRVDSQVEAARTAYQTARANPDAQTYAKEELNHAEQMLGAADTALASHEKQADVDHLAYLATQSSKTAIALGEAKASEQKVNDAAAARDRVRLEARTREAEVAKSAVQQTQAQLVAAEAQAADLQEQNRALAAMNAKQSSRGLVVTLGDMLFDTGKSELKSGATRELDNITTFLQDNPERQVLIEGFTDSVGGDEYNRELSERRADAVRAALISRGVAPARIVTRGYGKEFPVGTNEDAGGRQLNRRVEVVVSNDQNPVQPRS
jgi:outer membrane protein OmpA-like peptidoglycan-associated protein